LAFFAAKCPAGGGRPCIVRSVGLRSRGLERGRKGEVMTTAGHGGGC
jgi:hypothetical protein